MLYIIGMVVIVGIVGTYFILKAVAHQKELERIKGGLNYIFSDACRDEVTVAVYALWPNVTMKQLDDIIKYCPLEIYESYYIRKCLVVEDFPVVMDRVEMKRAERAAKGDF